MNHVPFSRAFSRERKPHGLKGFSRFDAIALAAVLVVLAVLGLVYHHRIKWKSNQHACIANLKQMHGAKVSWSLENQQGPEVAPTDSELFGTDKYIKTKPLCPAGGQYSLQPVGAYATCTIPGHSILPGYDPKNPATW